MSQEKTFLTTWPSTSLERGGKIGENQTTAVLSPETTVTTTANAAEDLRAHAETANDENLYPIPGFDDIFTTTTNAAEDLQPSAETVSVETLNPIPVYGDILEGFDIDIDENAIISELFPLDLPSISIEDLLEVDYLNERNVSNATEAYLSRTMFDVSTQTDTVKPNLDSRLLLEIETEMSEGDILKFPLHHLVRKNDHQGLLTLLKTNRRFVDEVDDLGRTASQIAILQQHHRCLLTLLQYDSDINVVDLFNNTLVHLAVKTNDKVSLILLKNYNPNYLALNKLGEPPAFVAFETEDPAMTDLIWQFSPKSFLIEHTDMCGLTYLHKAAYSNDENAAKRYVQIAKGKKDVLKIRVSNLSALHVSCELKNLSIIKIIYGFQPNQLFINDYQGRLPIHLIETEEIFSFFLAEKPAILQAINVRNGKQLIHYAAAKNKFG